MIDSIEFVESIPVLRDQGVELPTELLRKAFAGPTDLLNEDFNSNAARNAMFELTIAATAARRNLNPALSLGNPDVSFQFQGRFVKIECKRVMNGNKVFERLAEGVGQLEKTYDSGTNSIGIVALSMSRVLNPGNLWLESTEPGQALSNLLQTWLNWNEFRLRSMAKPWATAILFYLSTPAYVEGMGFTRAKHSALFPFKSDDAPILRLLARILKV